MCVYAILNGCKHVLFVDLILFKIKKCSHHPKSKSDDQHLIKNVEKRKEIEQVSIYVVQWCKWEKKLEGIIKMSLAFHLKKTHEMRKRGQKEKLIIIFTQIELTDFSFFSCISICGNALFSKHLLFIVNDQ